MEAVQNKVVTREIQVRNLTEDQIEKREAEFVISTEAVDTYGTVFRADGWDLSRFEKNPIVLYGHRSWDGNPDSIIGVGSVYREDNNLIGKVTFESEEINPLAEKVFRKVQAGTLRMASIGANPTKGHFGVEEAGEDPEVLYFDRQELLEFSIVPIGSNPDALKRNAETISELKRAISEPVPNFLEGGLVNGDSKLAQVRDIDVESTTVETTDQNKKLLSIREAQFQINKLKNVQ